MKHFIKKNILLSFLLFLPIYASNKETTDVFSIPFFQQRSQSDDIFKRLAGETEYLIDCQNCDCIYGIFSSSLAYSRSYDSENLAKFLFFNGKSSMTFGGENIATDQKDVNATNFLLGDDFEGTLNAHPRIENIIIDLHLRIYPPTNSCGFYFEFGMPIVWTQWEVNLEEKIKTSGATIDQFSLGNANDEQSPEKSIIEAWKGTKTFFDVRETMNNARINGSQTSAGIADLSLALGYNIICNDCGHFGIHARVKTPTSTRPDGQLLFQPIVGNGRHTQLGGGFSASVIMWDDCDTSLSLWMEGSAYHLFSSHQERTFDLKDNGPGSRYLLFKVFDTDNMYTNTIVRGPNATTVAIKTNNDLVGEAAFLLNYQNCNFSADIGYEIWGRTKEKIRITGEVPTLYGIQGAGQTMGGANVNRTASQTKIDGTNANQFDGANENDNVYLKLSDLDVKAAQNPSALSHKIAAHLSYSWNQCEYQPFLGLGGFVEFSGKGNRALNQWGIWGKAGVAFL